jgi:hypothetical protein
MKISYRMASPDDIDALVEFWSKNSGWDVIDREEWGKRFTDTPFGEAIVSIATDVLTKKIIGQFIFIPVKIAVNGKEVEAYRPFAPVLEHSLQSTFGIASLLTGQHPILRLYTKVADELTKKGIALIYMIPDPRWSRIFKAFPYLMSHKFPLWSYPLPMHEYFALPSEVSVDRIEPSDPGIDLLWNRASTVYPAAMVRNCRMMTWKTIQGDYRIFAVRNTLEMTGIFTIIYKPSDHQWLICDLVTRNNEESLSLTLAAACNMIQSEDNKTLRDHNHPGKIALLVTPVIEQIVKKMGFMQEDYHFTLVVHLLNKDGIDTNHLLPQNWYASAND